jgi:hypothetical protein
MFNHTITINNKKHTYTLKNTNKNTAFIECQSSNIAQEFLNEDAPHLLNDLPSLIIAEKKDKKQQTEIMRFRVNINDKITIEKTPQKRVTPQYQTT